MVESVNELLAGVGVPHPQVDDTGLCDPVHDIGESFLVRRHECDRSRRWVRLGIHRLHELEHHALYDLALGGRRECGRHMGIG